MLSGPLLIFDCRILKQYPDLDCVFLNSGTQSQTQLTKPAEVDLDAFHQEVSTNFTKPVDLSIKFLPHLQGKSSKTALIFTGTLLAHVPGVTMPAYSASKAALTAYVDCLRRQNAGSSTKFIEVWPPVVQSKSPFEDCIPTLWDVVDNSKPSFTTIWVK